MAKFQGKTDSQYIPWGTQHHGSWFLGITEHVLRQYCFVSNRPMYSTNLTYLIPEPYKNTVHHNLQHQYSNKKVVN